MSILQALELELHLAMSWPTPPTSLSVSLTFSSYSIVRWSQRQRSILLATQSSLHRVQYYQTKCKKDTEIVIQSRPNPFFGALHFLESS
jgi:hypothetical protein